MRADSTRSYTVVDVFTDVPLEGNPVAVFEDGSGLDDAVMQRVARELNLSETVFVLPSSNGAEDARVRIFTPLFELPFAGHPVLGTAFVLGAAGAVSATAIVNRHRNRPAREAKNERRRASWRRRSAPA